MHIMENNRFKVIIVEDVKLELKGTEEIFRHEIPNAEVIGTAMTENEFWELLKVQLPDMVLLDLGLGGSTTIGVEICSSLRKNYPDMKVLIFTGEVLNEKLWVDALNAGADGIILNFEFKKYLELQKEYTKLELTEKLTILFSTLIMVLVLIILGMVALFYLLFALAYVLEPLVGGLMASFAIIAGINVLLIALVIIFRKQLIISPMVNFLANLFLTDSNK